MTHEKSLETHAAERYALGQLSPEERDAFERHYFDCQECGKDVSITSEFVDNLKAVVRKQPKSSEAEPINSKRSFFVWLKPMALAASLALACVIGYQNTVTIPNLRSAAEQSSVAQIVPTLPLRPLARGTMPLIKLRPDARNFQLSLELSRRGHFASYACEVRSSAGTLIQKLSTVALESDTVNLLLPAVHFSPGVYEAVVFGVGEGSRTEIDRYEFMVRTPA